MTFAYLVEIYLPVLDVAVSAEWYKKHFGMKVIHQEEQKIKLAMQEGTLLSLEKAGELNHYVECPFNVNVYEAAEIYERLKNSGVRICQELGVFHHMTCFKVTDPNGYPIRVISWREEGYENTPIIRLGSAFLPVSNLSKALDWYENCLGISRRYEFTIRIPGYADEFQAAALRNMNLTLVEIPSAVSLQGRPFSIGTTNPKGQYEQLRAKGIMVSGYEDNRGKGSFQFLDPDQHEIGVIGILQ